MVMMSVIGESVWKTSVLANTNETAIFATGAGEKWDCTGVHASSSGVAAVVTFRDGTAGTSIATLAAGATAVPAGVSFTPPTPHKQASAGTTWTAQSTVANVAVTMSFTRTV